MIDATELASYDRHRSPEFPPEMDYVGIEQAGGRFLFWLSRSDGLLVFNVVAFDENDKAIRPWSGYATFFGKD